VNLTEFPTYDPGRFADGTTVEIRNEAMPTGRIRSALFDFDGTVSLIRTGWQDIMVPMMIEILREAGDEQPEEALDLYIREYVDRLTGKQTIFQMMQLAEEVEKRGGKALDPLEYKQMYNDRLMERIESRRDALLSGDTAPDDLMMPRTRELLEGFRDRGITLYLASGTDFVYVDEEAKMLGVDGLFDGGIYAALDRVEDFSKEMVIRQMFEEHGLQGPELVSFGDGYVEILNTKDAGGIPVGVASDEDGRVEVNEWKRNRLIQAGADIIIPGYQHQETLFATLFGEGG
jgi:phosphoglycolate phosphatase